jgi:D-alanyl-D-alanine carboxypeptidase
MVVYLLFNGEIIKDPETFNLIFTKIPTKDPEPSNYYLGIASYEFRELEAYGHGGFWGTIALYFPEIETSIAVFVLEKDKAELRYEIVDHLMGMLSDERR